MNTRDKSENADKAPKPDKPPLEPLAYTVDGASEVSGDLSRGTIYEYVGNGELPVVKVGRRTLILREDLLAFLRSKRQLKPSHVEPDAEAA